MPGDGQMGVCYIRPRMCQQTPENPKKEVYDGNITDKQNESFSFDYLI